MFPRDFRIPKRAKFKIYLIFEGCGGFRCGSLFGAVVVSTGRRWCASALSFWVCSVPLSACLLLLSCNTCEICSISHFKGAFTGFLLFRVGLLGLGALRGLCGFCAREWLGGYMTCGVFASVFPLLCLYFIRFSSSSPIFWGFAFVVLFLSSCLPFLFCLLLCPCGSLCFLFPLRTIRKKRAQVLASSLSVLCVFRFLCSY